MATFYKDPDGLPSGTTYENPDFTDSSGVISAPSVAVTGTSTATASVTYNLSSGTLWCYVSTDPNEPITGDHKDGTDAVDWVEITSPTNGVNNFSISGLAENTLYYAHFLGNDGIDDTNLAEASFTTQSLAISTVNGGSAVEDQDTAVEVLFNGVATTISSVTINGVSQSNIQTSVGGDDFVISFDFVWPEAVGSKYGEVLPITATASTSYISSVSFVPGSGYSYVDVSSYSATASGDVLTAIPDLEDGDQLEYETTDALGNTTYVTSDGYPVWVVSDTNSADTFQVRAIDPDDGTRSGLVSVNPPGGLGVTEGFVATIGGNAILIDVTLNIVEGFTSAIGEGVSIFDTLNVGIEEGVVESYGDNVVLVSDYFATFPPFERIINLR